MRLIETLPLLNPTPPPAPYGDRSLTRCHSIEDMAAEARRRLPSGARGHLDGGAAGEYTLRRNREAFAELELVPDMPRRVDPIDTSTTVLEQAIRRARAAGLPNIAPAHHRSREKLDDMLDGTVSMDDPDWIRELWDGPIPLGSVLRPEEALRAAAAEATERP